MTRSELTKLEAALAQANSNRMTFSAHENAIHISSGTAPRDEVRDLDLAALPPGSDAQVTVVLNLSCSVRLTGLRSGVTLNLTVRGRSHLVIGPNNSGRIILTATDPLPISAEAEGPVIELAEGHLTTSPGDHPVRIHVTSRNDGACRLGGEGGDVSLAGCLTLPTSGTELDTLYIEGDSELSVDGAVQIKVLTGATSAELNVKRVHDHRRTKPQIGVRHGHQLTLCGEVEVDLRTARAMTFCGPKVSATVRENGEGLVFTEQASLALAKQSAVVVGLQGQPRLKDLKGGTLIGDPDTGFTIGSVLSAGALEDAQLENVRLRAGLDGLKVLAEAENCRRIEPDPRDLPGWDLRFQVRTLPSAHHAERLATSYDADLMRRFAELCRAKGASGSASTKVGWCAQRLRHQVTPGRWEQAALWGYRLLGYGERPGPALLTWLGLSLLFAVVLAAPGGWQVDLAGFRHFLSVWAEDAISPVGAILGTGATATESAWVYLVRALVAVPLVVGLLSLRKYTRAS